MAWTSAQALDGQRLEPVFLVEIALGNSGPTLYLSTRNVTVGAQGYEDYIADIAGIGEQLSRLDSSGLNASVTLTLKNRPWRSYNYLIDADNTAGYPFIGSVTTIKEVYLDADGQPSDAVTVFVGICEEPRNIRKGTFEVTIGSRAALVARQFAQTVLNTTTWPSATDDVGKIVPIVYGSGVLIPALWSDRGGITTLAQDITTSTTGQVEITAPGNLPTSGYVWIDEEVIGYNKTGSSATQINITLRAQGGTTAAAHASGAQVWEKQATYQALLADNLLDNVSTIYAEVERRLMRVTSGVSASTSGGRHYLNATSQISVGSGSVSITDGIGVTNYTPQSERIIERHSTTLPLQWDDVAATYTLSFPASPGGTINNVRARITYQVVVNTAPSSTTVQFLYSEPTPDVVLCSVDTSGTILYNVPQTFEVAVGSWDTGLTFTTSSADGDITFTITDAVMFGEVVSTWSGDPGGGRVVKASSGPVQWLDYNGSHPIPFPVAPSGTLSDVYAEYEWGVVVNTNPTSDVTFHVGAFASGTIVGKVDTSGNVTRYIDKIVVSHGSSWDTTPDFIPNSNSGDIDWTVSSGKQYAVTTGEDSYSYAEKTGTVTGSGGVGIRQVERFHALVDGYEDTGGDYAGAGTVVERPDHVIEHWLVNHCGFSASDIDSTSFGAAGTSYGSTYKLAFALMEQIGDPIELAKRMAWECRSVLYYDAGKWYLDYLPDTAPSADATVNEDDTIDGFTFDQMPWSGLANDLTARYAEVYSIQEDGSQWSGTVTDSDSTSITKYGTYADPNIEFQTVRNATHAAGTLAHMLKQRKTPLHTLAFAAPWTVWGKVNRGSTIQVTTDIAGMTGKKFYIEEISRDGAVATIRAREWWA